MSDEQAQHDLGLEELWLQLNEPKKDKQDDNKGSSVTLNDRILQENQNGINGK